MYVTTPGSFNRPRTSCRQVIVQGLTTFIPVECFKRIQSFTLTLPLFIGYPLILVSSTNLHVFATTVCLLTLRPTSLTLLPFTPLPVSFAQVLSPVVHLSVQYPMVKGLSQDFCLGGGTRPTPPSLASVVHTFEAVAGSRGSVSAPAVSRVIDGAPERNKNNKKIYVK